MNALHWLSLPLSGAAEHHLAPWAAWHARCMVLAWSVLLPLGVLAARYFKVLPGQNWPQQLDHPGWWAAHRVTQYSGIAIMTLGLALAYNMGSRSNLFAQAHVWAGWALCIAGWAQVCGGWLRGSKGGPTEAGLRGDHYDMTPRRLAFETIHKTLGWLCLLAAILVTALGLVVADAPRWMALALTLWWAALALTATVLQKRGRCVDTYQAIWGPGAEHPGNGMAPIGWGIRRPSG